MNSFGSISINLDVNRVSLQVPLTVRASIVIIKTALKTENFEEALTTFRELKDVLATHSGPSTAPKQIAP